MNNLKSIRIAAIAASFLFASGVQADTQLTVTVFDQFEGSSELVAGEYAEATAEILKASSQSRTRHSARMDVAQLLSNLCIAQIKSEQIDAAKKTCRKAVSTASSISTGIGVSRSEIKKIKANAYNNRGVLRVLTTDRAGAIDDFTKAARLNPAALENRQNLSAALAMDSGIGIVAQVDIRD